MNSSVLHVLGYGVYDQPAVLGHSIHVDLATILNEFGNNNGMFLRDLGCHTQKADQLIFRVGNVHCRTRQHIRRAHEAWVANFRAKQHSIGLRRKHAPRRLVNTNLRGVGSARLRDRHRKLYHICKAFFATLNCANGYRIAKRRKFVSIFGSVDHLWGCARNFDCARFHLQSKRVRDLAAHGYDCLLTPFEFVYVKNSLKRELLEVESIALVVIRGDSLRIVVNHHCLLTERSKRTNCRNRAPVELN
mmetsp:Transcript_43803/g.100287  ORF Transcript_43803/g.100287 Transcript_43803/m.100287 type:complete len:247 (+) Transcript_43803:1409-2149(+)